MDYARHEMMRTTRRLIASALALSLLVAFWADRPNAAASMLSSGATEVAPGGELTAPAEPAGTAIISLLRRPWLGFYTLCGAPALNHGKLTSDEEVQFAVVVGLLAIAFAVGGAWLWYRGKQLIDLARRP